MSSPIRWPRSLTYLGEDKLESPEDDHVLVELRIALCRDGVGWVCSFVGMILRMPVIADCPVHSPAQITPLRTAAIQDKSVQVTMILLLAARHY